jgi:hypothetical protein
MKRAAYLIVVAALLVAGVASAQGTRWINVHVTEPSSETNVEVHLPLDLVLTVLKGVRVDHFDAGKVDLDLEGAEIDWPEIMAALRDAPDGKFVNATTAEADVQVSKESGLMLIHVTQKEDEHAVVDVRVPVQLMDILSIDDDNRIDVAGLIQSITDLPDGELVRVTSDEANVRVWVE